MMINKRIVIADDHTVVREGIKALISSNPNFEVVGEARDGLEAVRAVGSLQPDLILMDLSMPRMDGMGAILEIKKNCPGTKILVLTAHKAEEYIMATLKAGADGYVPKDARRGELLIAMEYVFSGSYYISPEISQDVIKGYLENKKAPKPTSWGNLTQREREILKLIAENYKNKQIADFLCISLKTVEKHRANLMKKLNLHNVSEITSYAIDKGLVTK